MYVEQFFVDGLGCASYLVACEAQGVAAVVDPDRAVDRYLRAAAARGLKITTIVETHLHADHVSGNTELAARTGADIYLHENAGAEFAHKPLRAGAALTLGNVRLDVLHTPGHTPESVTLLVADQTRGPEPWMALTGDTLFVGDVGRPDLVGAEAARALAGALHASLFEQLLPLGDGLLIYPGHGAGSLCGKSIGAVRSTTLGFERRHNPALAPRSAAEFVDFATHDLPEQPGNHTRIKALNRRGPRVLGEIQPHPLSVPEARGRLARKAVLLDTRPRSDYVQGHIAGSAHLPADDQLSSRAGFVLPPESAIILVIDDPAHYADTVYSLARVGFDDVVGYLAEGPEAWEAQGLHVVGGDIVDIEPAQLKGLLEGEAGRPVVLDVREPWEFRQGHVPGAILIPLGELGGRVQELDPAAPLAVICASGNRSQSAAALLAQRGFATLYNVRGGTSAWVRLGLAVEK